MVIARKLLPWIASIAAHAGLVLVPVQLERAAAGALSPQRRVELVFDSGGAAEEARASLVSERPAGEAVLAASGIRLPPSLPMPGPSRVPAPPSSAPTAATLAPARAATASVASAPGLPSPRDVLASMPEAGVSASTMAATRAAAEEAAIAGAALEPPSPAGGEPLFERIGWKGSARTVVRRVSPQFPPVLSASGQEVECEAAITVSPLGTVVDVEITRSSGYTEVDASVEAALRQYIFSRIEGRQNVVGTVSFQFRLEKRD